MTIINYFRRFASNLVAITSLGRVMKLSCTFGVLVVILLATNVAPGASQNDTPDNRARTYDLLDQEKELLKRDDDLSRAIFEKKREMNELDKKLADLERTRSNVKHALIAVQLKLIR